MKQRVFVSLFILMVGNLAAWGQQYLEPVGSWLDTYDSRQEYDQNLRNFFLKKLPGQPVAQVVVLPSFTPEWAIVADSTTDGKCSVKVFKAAAMIYQAKGEVAIDKQERGISPKLAKDLGFFFRELILQTHYPVEKFDIIDGKKYLKVSLKFDGTSYLFSSWFPRGGVQSGRMHSPDKNSYLAEVEGFTESLLAFVNGKISEEKIKEKLQYLQNKLPRIRE